MKNNVKVLILTEGGKDTGFGHTARCLALYQGFKHKGIIAEIIVNGDESVRNIFGNIKYTNINWVVKKEEVVKIVKDYNIVIIDSYLADLDFYKTISNIVETPVYIDDLKRLDYPKGIIVNPSIAGGKLKYSFKKWHRYLLGKEFVILRKVFWHVPDKNVKKNIKNILISFGGKDNSSLIYAIREYLRSKGNFNIDIKDANQNKATAKEMVKSMLKADVCISGGGQTIYELARIGVPTIGICLAKNQLLNLKECSQIGLLDFIGWYNDNRLMSRIEMALEGFDYKKRLKMNQVCKKYIDGKGSKRITKEILKYAIH